MIAHQDSRHPFAIAAVFLSAIVACAMLSAIQPADAATTYHVGSTRSYKTLSSLPTSLQPGDVVEIDPGTYNEVKQWTASGTAANPIIIRGVGASRPVIDATGKTVTGEGSIPRGVFQIDGDYVTVENLRFTNARNGNNGAGIRVNGGDNVIIRNSVLDHNDMGLMSNDNASVLVERSEVAFNGTANYDQYSHNVYVDGMSATFRGCYIHDATNGQNVKSRAHYTELFYNRIARSQDGEIGLVDSGTTASANSNAVMIGNVVVGKVRPDNYNNGRFIEFGQDQSGAHNGTLAAFNNTFVAGDSRIDFLSCDAATASIVAKNNIFYGSNTILGTNVGSITGTDNWLASTASVPAGFSSSTISASPGFVNLSGGNYHLTTSSACINQGANGLTYLDGSGVSHDGTPTLEYVNDLSTTGRVNIGILDIGAYEVPEPGTLGLILPMVATALLRRRRRA